MEKNISVEVENQAVERRAIDILREYTGNNNFLIVLKNRVNRGDINLGRKTSEYVVKNYNKKVIGINKWYDVDSYCGEELQKKFLCVEKPTKIYIQKILAETDKAIHIWGKVWEEQNMTDMWIPKHSIIKPKPINIVNISPDHWTKYERPPYPHQIIGITKLLEHDRFILADDMGLGKMESVNNRVFTPKGRIRIGDLKVGDKIIGSDGKSYTVTGVFPKGVQDLYRVTFNDGYSVLVGREHLWSVSSSYSGQKTKNCQNRYVILSTEQMLDQTLKVKQNGVGNNATKTYEFNTYYKKKDGRNKWQIPIVQPIEFSNNHKLPIDPYLLGLILGNGHIHSRFVSFTCHKDDFDEMFDCYNIIEKPINHQRPNVRFCVIHCNSLKELNLQHTRPNTKFIPDMYKYSTINERLELLRGLMDADGYCHQATNGAEYCTTSKQLADDVAEIVHSLGGIVKFHSKIPIYKHNGIKKNGKKAYRLNIKLPLNLNPFKLKRKHDQYNPPNKSKISRYIQDIRFETKGEAVCISVDSPDKLYVTEHAIVTHNTTEAIIGALECKAKKILIVCPASLKLNWKKEIELYDCSGAIHIIHGSKWISGGKWTIVNYDILKNFHTIRDRRKKDQVIQSTILDENFDLIIADEAHYLKNRTAQRTKLFNDFAKSVKRLWLLTGTPITNRPMDYFNLLELCNHRLARSWVGYAIRYCAGKQFYGRGGHKVWDTKGSSNLEELRDNTRDVILRRRKEDILELPEKIIQPIYLPLRNSTEYKQIVGEYQTWAEHQKNFNLALHLAQLVKLRQFLALSKIESTIEIVENAIEADKKVVIFTNFTETLQKLHNHFGAISVIHHGPMNEKRRDESVASFQNDPKIKVFIGNIVSAGVGITLTAAELVVFNDLSWLPADHLQAQDRAHRIGQTKKVNVYYNIIDETLDLHLFHALMKKMKVIDTVMGDSNVDDNLFHTVIEKLK